MSRVVWSWFKQRAKRAAGLVITSHRKGLLPILIECSTSPALFDDIIAEFVDEESDILRPLTPTLFTKHAATCAMPFGSYATSTQSSLRNRRPPPRGMFNLRTNTIAQTAGRVYYKRPEEQTVKSVALIILLQTVLFAATSAQDPRRPPPTADAPERPKGAALTFGGRTKEDLVPNPYRVQSPPERVSAAVEQVLKEIELPLDARKSRTRAGIFVTEWFEFAKGVNSRSGLQRVADLPAGEIHNWSSGRYQLEIRVSLVETNVSLVTVNAVIEGLFQDVAAKTKETADGTWVVCQSRGVIENNILRALRGLVER